MHARSLRSWLIVLAVGSALTALADASGPPTGRTGAPAIGPRAAENNCTGCHGDNSLQTSGLEILDVPAHFQAGAVYTLRVRLTSGQTAGSPQRKWGFQMAALDAATGDSCGSLGNVSGQGTQVTNGSGSRAARHYIAQNNSGTRTGTTSPVEWQVRWHAPTNGAVGARFHATALAGDGDGNESGDWVYSASAVSTDTVTATLQSSWGALKARYR